MKLLLFALMVAAFAGCRSSNHAGQAGGEKQPAFEPVFTPGPPTMVYKTRKDYRMLVPVILSEDKTTIVSYPHPSDIKTGSGYATPTALNGGYLLDNRGINENVAFLKLTYEEYAALKEAPAPDELYAMILDDDPLTELCNCGNRSAFADVITRLNQIIDRKKLRSACKPVKF
jgi:hypothetical protein